MKKITVYPLTGPGDGFTLGDNTAARGSAGFILDIGNGGFDGVVQEVPNPGGGAPSFFDRGNETVNIGPRIDIGFASEALRDDYLLGLQIALPQVGHVEIVTNAGQSVWIPNAKMRPISWALIGDVAAVITYSIRGQKIQTESPRNA